MNIIFGVCVCVCARACSHTFQIPWDWSSAYCRHVRPQHFCLRAAGGAAGEDVGDEEESLPSSENLGSSDEQDSMPEGDIDVMEGGAMGLSSEQQWMMKKMERR